VLIGGEGPLPGASQGLAFSSGGQTGMTDAQGTFQYFDGAPITFTIGSVQIGPIPGRAKLSPFQLAGTCTNSPALVHLLVLIDSLDSDHDRTNGIQLPAFSATGAPQPLAGLSDADVSALIGQLAPGALVVSATTAIDGFIAEVDGEAWQETTTDSFPLLEGLTRSQGVATDGTYWYFAWRLGLDKADAQYMTVASNNLAIPGDLALGGVNHIGDVDFYNGLIYASEEQDPAQLQPHIVTYDPNTLSSVTEYALDDTVQTEGAPWVTVNGPRGEVYASHWDPVPAINVFDLNNGLMYLRSIPIRPVLGRIQGAKIYEGSLYATVDRTAKMIYKIDLDTGTALLVQTLSETGVEMEGLAFRMLSDGSVMHTLNVNQSTTGTEFHHHQRTRPPLRLELCP
jgi:hypothetical protein